MLDIAARMTWIINELRRALGVFAVRESRAQQVVWLGTQAYTPKIPPNQPPKLPAEIWSLFWRRFNRMATRFQTLLDRWRTNTLPKKRPPRLRPVPKTTPSGTPTQPPAVRLPRAHGWVNRRIPESAPASGQLSALLRDPEARAFVEAAPQAGRLLRPLCRALGILQPDWLRLPRRPRKPRPMAPSALQTHPSNAPTPQDRPFQPYVRAAIRAWKKKSG